MRERKPVQQPKINKIIKNIYIHQYPPDLAIKTMLWKCCTQCQQIWKTQQWPQDWKRSVFIPIPKKGNSKECSNYCTNVLISHTSNAQNSPSQASAIHEPWTMNFQMFKLVLEKAEESEIKLPTSAGSSKKQESSRRTSISALTMPKPLTVWLTINCGKFFKRWAYQTTYLPLEKLLWRSGSNS